MMRPDPGLRKIYLCIEPVDFRKAIQSLSLSVDQALELNPFEPTLFVFINRRRDKIKFLYWGKNGFCLRYKRLQKQRFKWPAAHDSATLTLNGKQLNWLLDGLDLGTDKPHDSLSSSAVG